VKVALFGGRKRSPESDEGYAEEEEDEEEGRPLGLAFPNRARGPAWRATGTPQGTQGPLVLALGVPCRGSGGAEGGGQQQQRPRELPLEPGQFPPESPRGAVEGAEGLMLSKARYGPGVPPALMAQGPGGEADAEDGLQGSRCRGWGSPAHGDLPTAPPLSCTNFQAGYITKWVTRCTE